VKSAARRFFLTTDPGSPFPRGKRLEEVTVGETALLAGLIHNPEGDNPFEHPNRARQRRDEVLEGMVKARKITRAQADMAAREPLPTVKPAAVDLKPSNAWAEQAQSILLRDRRLGATVAERRKKILQGGLQVHTTLDQGIQQIADQAVANGLVGARPGFGAALVAMDPKNGEVKAMTDSRPYSESKFNIAVDGAGRQVGSSFKVVALAAMLQNGYSRNDQVDGIRPVQRSGLRGQHHERRGRWTGGDAPRRDDRVRELRVCAPVDERRHGEGRADGAADGRTVRRHRATAGFAVGSGAHVPARSRLGHAGRDGHRRRHDREWGRAS
jgi:membrane peptidoglycan carboxypeptidase